MRRPQPLDKHTPWLAVNSHEKRQLQKLSSTGESMCVEKVFRNARTFQTHQMRRMLTKWTKFDGPRLFFFLAKIQVSAG